MDTPPGTTDSRQDRHALATFLVLAVCLSAIAVIPIVRSGSLSVWGGTATTLFMWAPGVAGVIASLIVFRSVRPLGLLGNTRLVPLAVLCLLVPVAYTLVIYPTLAALGLVSLGHGNVNAAFFVVGGFLSLRAALGEELGWRGFAAPVMARVFGFGMGQAVLGIVWFLYHLPVLLLTDYGKSPHLLFGNLMFLASVVGMSYFMGWVRLRSNSVWPSALLHASHNLVFLHLFDPLGLQGPAATYLVGEQGLALALVQLAIGGATLYAARKTSP